MTAAVPGTSAAGRPPAEVALVGDPGKKGWGTFVTNLDAGRELAIQIPHPLNDLDTPLAALVREAYPARAGSPRAP